MQPDEEGLLNFSHVMGFMGALGHCGWFPVCGSEGSLMHLSAKACGTAFPVYSTSPHPSAVRGPVPYFKCSRAWKV